MDVTVIIPRNVNDPIPIAVPTTSSSSKVIMTLNVARSRMVWRELDPCLFLQRGQRSHQRKVAQRRMLLCLLSHFYFNNNNGNNPPAHSNDNTRQSLQMEKRVDATDDDSNNTNFDFALLRQRRIRLGHDLLNHFLSASTTIYSPSASATRYPSQLILFIQPPKIMIPAARFEYYWETTLIHLEHRLILAQSLAGLYSTLGGGCHMTRRMSTAIVLAQQQQRMALILNVSFAAFMIFHSVLV
jgi:hypothetical protein